MAGSAMTTCPNCGATWIWKAEGDSELTPADRDWLDWHFAQRKCLE